ncbi:hypothetical protein [Ferrovibrio xuzhouensis]|uniref:Uncharacterized protein n=1 Tax=Ferrovibrio xuzhouensis TaxID=1576914 RepID=A0ABV7VHI9_9PROT
MSTIPSVGQTGGYYPPVAGTGKKPSPVADSADVAATDKKTDSVEDQFLDFAKMSVADRIRAQYLGGKGLTEEDLKNMDPKERQKIEDEIREQIKEALKRSTEKKAGGIVNITA